MKPWWKRIRLFGGLADQGDNKPTMEHLEDIQAKITGPVPPEYGANPDYGHSAWGSIDKPEDP